MQTYYVTNPHCPDFAFVLLTDGRRADILAALRAGDLVDYNRQIGVAVRDARRRVGITQDDLAQRAGLSRPSITNIEGGRQQLTVNQLMILSKALGVEPIKLLPTVIPSTGNDLVIESIPSNRPDLRLWAEKLVASDR